jgi:acyl-CoA thioester hydrolase
MTTSTISPSAFFSHTVRLRWRDMDSYNHVNNSEYLTLCEEARIAWFHSLAGPWRSDSAEPVIARIELDYLRPLVHPNDVIVRLFLDRLGGSSLSLLHTLSVTENEREETLYAKGKSILVWIDPQTGKSTPLPAFVRNFFSVA